jgi:hypothetical protein
VIPPPSAAEQTAPLAILLVGGTGMSLAILGPIEWSGYALAVGLGYTFLGMIWMLVRPATRRLVKA